MSVHHWSSRDHYRGHTQSTAGEGSLSSLGYELIDKYSFHLLTSNVLFNQIPTTLAVQSWRIQAHRYKKSILVPEIQFGGVLSVLVPSLLSRTSWLLRVKCVKFVKFVKFVVLIQRKHCTLIGWLDDVIIKDGPGKGTEYLHHGKGTEYLFHVPFKDRSILEAPPPVPCVVWIPNSRPHKVPSSDYP